MPPAPFVMYSFDFAPHVPASVDRERESERGFVTVARMSRLFLLESHRYVPNLLHVLICEGFRAVLEARDTHAISVSLPTTARLFEKYGFRAIAPSYRSSEVVMPLTPMAMTVPDHVVSRCQEEINNRHEWPWSLGIPE